MYSYNHITNRKGCAKCAHVFLHLLFFTSTGKPACVGALAMLRKSTQAWQSTFNGTYFLFWYIYHISVKAQEKLQGKNLIWMFMIPTEVS